MVRYICAIFIALLPIVCFFYYLYIACIAYNDNGEKIKCNALFTFESDETGKNYIVYTDNTTDEEGNKKVYASTFDPKEENPVLGPIETDEEWKVIENILNKLQEGTKSE